MNTQGLSAELSRLTHMGSKEISALLINLLQIGYTINTEETFEDLTLIRIENAWGNQEKLPEPVLVPTLPLVSAFLAVNNPDISWDEAVEQKRQLESQRPHEALEFFSYTLFQATVENLTFLSVCKNVHLDPYHLIEFQNILQKNGLFWSLEQNLDGFFIIFRDEQKRITAINDVGGFALPRNDSSPELPRGEKSQSKNGKKDFFTKWNATLQEYSGQESITFLPLSLTNLDNLAAVLEQTSQPLRERKRNRKQEEQKELERATFRADLEAYLQPLLQEVGRDLVDAKLLMSPDENDSLTDDLLFSELKNRDFPLVDFLLVGQHPQIIDIEEVDMYGWKTPPKRDNQPGELTVYGNVCGLILVDNDTPLSERKKLIREAGPQLRRYYPTQPKPMFLTVDPRLLEEWKNQESPLVNAAVVEEHLLRSSSKKLVDYGFYENFTINRENPPQVELHIYEPEHSHIGGTQLTLVVRRDEQVANAILLDRGWVFDLVPTWSSLGKNPSYADGIMPFLRMGMFDQTRRLYRLDLLQNSINSAVLDFGLQQSQQSSSHEVSRFAGPEEFVLLEVFHRLGEDGFIQFLQDTNPVFLEEMRRLQTLRSFIGHLKQREKFLYQQKTIFDLAALTHAHQDHTLGFSLLRDELPIGMHPITRALALADHRLSANWLAQDVAVRKMRELDKVGSSYLVHEKPYYLFEDGQTLEISPGIKVTGFDVYHSIPGSLGFVVEVEHQGERIASLAYGGDYRDGRFFNRVGEMGGTDLLIVEGTNPPSAKKNSMHFTEDDVQENFDNLLTQALHEENLIVVDLVKNAFERLQNMIDVATVRGRSIVISARIAKKLQLLQLTTRGSIDLPILTPGDPRIKIWVPIKDRYSADEKEMFELFGTCTASDLRENPQQYLLIRENENPEKLEGIGRRVTWIDSTYGPYTEAARQEKKFRNDYAQQQGWEHFTKGFHSSGHTPIVPPDDPRASHTALASLADAQAREIVVLHTERRGEVSNVVKQYVDPSVTEKIHDKIVHPRHKILLTR